MDLAADILQIPEIACDFWNLHQRDNEYGIVSLWNTALEYFPYNFGALSKLAAGLAQAGSNSVTNVSNYLTSLIYKLSASKIDIDFQLIFKERSLSIECNVFMTMPIVCYDSSNYEFISMILFCLLGYFHRFRIRSRLHFIEIYTVLL